MAKHFNQVTIQGNLGSDAELGEFQNGTKYLKMSVANSRDYKNANGEAVEKTFWVKARAYGKLAETLSPYLVKGKGVIISGELETGSFTDDEGIKRGYAQINANEINLLGSGKQQQGGEQASTGGLSF